MMRERFESVFRRLQDSAGLQYLVAVGVVILVSVANSFLEPIIGTHPTALIYLLAVVILALFVDRGPTMIAAILSAIIWDYYFLSPVFALRITHVEDTMLLATYFIVALVLGELTARTRAHEKALRQEEARATALYLLTRELANATQLHDMLQKVVQQMRETFKAEIVILLTDSADRSIQQIHPTSTFQLSENEKGLATWILRHGCSSRDTGEQGGQKETLYVPLSASNVKFGVIGLRLAEPLKRDQRNLLDAFTRQIALALDRHRLEKESERAGLLAESERLSKTMLNSMSHEIRTPIAVIKSATSNVLEMQDSPLSNSQLEMIGEIQTANDRLDRLVGKALDITRLESGHVRPKMTPCDVKDLIQVAVKDTRKELAQHKLTVEVAPELPLVSMDFVMTQQALTNLLSNAAIHTRPGTTVRLNAHLENGGLILAVADNGPGIPKDSMSRVFEKFYRCPNAPTGGTGLGLSLVKGFVEAQGGRVSGENGTTGGVTFTISLPVDRISSGSHKAES